MFADSAVEERECIQIEPNAKQGLSNASPRIWVRFNAASPKRSVGTVPV
jgi:hypothetical protein